MVVLKATAIGLNYYKEIQLNAFLCQTFFNRKLVFTNLNVILRVLFFIILIKLNHVFRGDKCYLMLCFVHFVFIVMHSIGLCFN